MVVAEPAAPNTCMMQLRFVPGTMNTSASNMCWPDEPYSVSQRISVRGSVLLGGGSCEASLLFTKMVCVFVAGSNIDAS